MAKSMNTVVISMDGSEHSDYALKFYAESIHKPGNKVVLIHCGQYALDYGSASLVQGNPGLIQRMISEEEHKIDEILDHMKQRLKDLQIENGDVVKVQGEIGHGILEKAKELNADMIVTGARGKGKLRRTLTGSTCDYIVHHSKIPVIVCKHPDSHHHHHQH